MHPHPWVVFSVLLAVGTLGAKEGGEGGSPELGGLPYVSHRG